MYSCEIGGRSIILYVDGAEVWKDLKLLFSIRLDFTELQELQVLLKDPKSCEKIMKLNSAEELVQFILFSK